LRKTTKNLQRNNVNFLREEKRKITEMDGKTIKEKKEQ
jgi:hypothetical protein